MGGPLFLDEAFAANPPLTSRGFIVGACAGRMVAAAVGRRSDFGPRMDIFERGMSDRLGEEGPHAGVALTV